MLVEFAVKNFRSIKDEARLSLLAYAPDKTHPEAVLHPQVAKGKKAPSILKAAAIYGPNNAGKSNLYRAGFAMRQIVLTSAVPAAMTPFGGALQTWVQPFRLDVETASAPTTFEVTFFIGQGQYTYGFTADSSKVHEEWLYVWPTGSGRRQIWFERSSPEYSDKWNFGSALTGMTKSAQQAYRHDALFLSVAATLQNEKLAPIVDWFTHKFHFMDATPDYTLDAFKAQLEQDPKFGEWAREMLMRCNLRIDSFGLLNMAGGNQMAVNFPAEIPDQLRQQFKEQQRIAQLRVHIPRTIRGATAPKGATAFASFDLEQDESRGTKRIAILLPMLYTVLQTGASLWIDELETSLHVLQAKLLIELMQNPDFNPKGAQLIFTSHQALLLDPAIFRRDQIYLMDCDGFGASSMASLLDFEARKTEAWCKGYLSGRYGAVPSLSAWVEPAAGADGVSQEGGARE